MAARIDPPETRYVTVDEVEVAYQVVGSGRVDLVFHHGMCHVDLQWDPEPEAAFLAALASFSRLIVFDRRGIGASERIAGETLPSWEEWSEDLRAVLDAVGSERAAIFAETEAGPTAVLFAAAHPERVSALVLGNTTARFTVADDYPIGLPAEAVELSAAIWEASWGKPELVNLGFPSFRGRDRDVRSLCKLMRAAATPRAAARQYRHVWTMDVRRVLPLVTAPTLVLHSETDAPGVDQAAFWLSEFLMRGSSKFRDTIGCTSAVTSSPS